MNNHGNTKNCMKNKITIVIISFGVQLTKNKTLSDRTKETIL